MRVTITTVAAWGQLVMDAEILRPLRMIFVAHAETILAPQSASRERGAPHSLAWFEASTSFSITKAGIAAIRKAVEIAVHSPEAGSGYASA